MRVKSGTDSRRGQSLVELALIMPMLITLLLGMVEVVNIGRTYLALLDSSYQGAHLGSQGSKRYTDAQIKILIQQDLTNKGLYNDTIGMFIAHGTLNGGTAIPTYSINDMMSSPTATPIPSTKAVIQGRLTSGDPPNGRFIAVEIVYNYHLLFPWPKITGLLQDPFTLRAYTIQYSPRP